MASAILKSHRLELAPQRTNVDVQSKERLTGAVILVVLIVLVVPELLRGPRRAAEPVADPVEGPPTRHYTIELGDRATTRPARPQTPAASRPRPPQAAPAPEEAAQQEPQQPAPAETNPPPAQPPAREASVRPAVPEPAAEGEALPAKGWSIQVGSFASRENADRFAGELRRQGFKSFLTEGTGGGRRLYHVRVGPEADRRAAQAVAARLKSSGRTGFLVPYP
jgi:DedD protein